MQSPGEEKCDIQKKGLDCGAESRISNFRYLQVHLAMVPFSKSSHIGPSVSDPRL